MSRKSLTDCGSKTRQIRTCHKRGKVGDPEVRSGSRSSALSPSGQLSFQSIASTLCRCKGGCISQGAVPVAARLACRSLGVTMNPLHFTWKLIDSQCRPASPSLCSTKAFCQINKLLCCARVVVSHAFHTAPHLCAETSCRQPCRQT